MAGSKGSRLHPAPGGTTSRWETRAIVGPVPQPCTSTRTPEASRTRSSPHRRAVASTKTATSASSPLTDGMATSSRRSSISLGKVDAEIGRLLLAADDHGATAGSGEHLEQQRIGNPTIDDMGPFHS